MSGDTFQFKKQSSLATSDNHQLALFPEGNQPMCFIELVVNLGENLLELLRFKGFIIKGGAVRDLFGFVKRAGIWSINV